MDVREEEAPAPNDRPTRVSALGRGFPWNQVVVPWLVSRLVSAATILAAASHPFSHGLRFTGFTFRWDGGFYFGIARDGYGSLAVPFPRWPFFPGLPAVIRLLGELGNDEVGIFVVNQVALLLALAGVYRIARRHGSDDAARLAVWALALFPASFVFSMTYPSALFLAASVWAFALVEDGHDVIAAMLVAGAAMLRPNGIVVAVALTLAVRTWRRIAVVCLPAVVALAGWCWYCWDRTGDAFVFLTTKERWQEISAVGLVDGHAKWTVLPHAALALAAVVVIIRRRRRLPVSWLAFTALYLLPSLVTGMVGLARYTNECFPPFVAAGQVLERWPRRVRVAMFVASSVGLVLFGFVVGRYELVP